MYSVVFSRPLIEAGANFPKVIELSGSCGRYESGLYSCQTPLARGFALSIRSLGFALWRPGMKINPSGTWFLWAKYGTLYLRGH